MTRSGMPVAEYLGELRDAGLGTLPGTSAEILDDEVRDRISRGRITTRQWLEIITTAHRLGIRTTSTMMYGHVETPAHWVRHMALLRDVQKDTGGFTEFVPLSLIHQEAPMYRRRLVQDVRAGATGAEVVRVHALARLMLGATVRNIQCSWVKEGPKLAQMLLAAGANDLGGTLINESISTSAGAGHGQLVPPRELRRLVRDLGRIPAQRDTTYGILRLYADGSDDDTSPARCRREPRRAVRLVPPAHRVESVPLREAEPPGAWSGAGRNRRARQAGSEKSTKLHSHPCAVASPPHPERRRFYGERIMTRRRQRWPTWRTRPA